MNESENFAENYYPKDINLQNNKKNEKHNAFSLPNFSTENLLNLLGGKENALASMLLSNKFSNFDISKDPSAFLKTFSQVSNQKKKTTNVSKKIDDDYFEEI